MLRSHSVPGRLHLHKARGRGRRQPLPWGQTWKQTAAQVIGAEAQSRHLPEMRAEPPKHTIGVFPLVLLRTTKYCLGQRTLKELQSVWPGGLPEVTWLVILQRGQGQGLHNRCSPSSQRGRCWGSSRSNRASGHAPELTPLRLRAQGDGVVVALGKCLLCGLELHPQHQTRCEESHSLPPPPPSLLSGSVQSHGAGVEPSGRHGHLVPGVSAEPEKGSGRYGAALLATRCGVLGPQQGGDTGRAGEPPGCGGSGPGPGEAVVVGDGSHTRSSLQDAHGTGCHAAIKSDVAKKHSMTRKDAPEIVRENATHGRLYLVIPRSPSRLSMAAYPPNVGATRSPCQFCGPDPPGAHREDATQLPQVGGPRPGGRTQAQRNRSGRVHPRGGLGTSTVVTEGQVHPGRSVGARDGGFPSRGGSQPFRDDDLTPGGTGSLSPGWGVDAITKTRPGRGLGMDPASHGEELVTPVQPPKKRRVAQNVPVAFLVA